MTKRKYEVKSNNVGLYTPVSRQKLYAADKDNPLPEAFGSDSKTKNRLGLCGLCLSPEMELVRGHVVPQAVAKRIKKRNSLDQSLFAIYEDVTKPYKIQDLLYHYMFCGPCDEYLGVGEAYLMEISAAAKNRDSSSTFNIDVSNPYKITFNNINFSLLMRGLLGIAIKTHYSPAAEVGSIRGSQLIERLRRSLLDDRYGWLQPPFDAIYWEGFAKIDPRDIAYSMVIPLKDGCDILELEMEGINWTVPLYPIGKGLTNPFREKWNCEMRLRDLRESSVYKKMLLAKKESK